MSTETPEVIVPTTVQERLAALKELYSPEGRVATEVRQKAQDAITAKLVEGRAKTLEEAYAILVVEEKRVNGEVRRIEESKREFTSLEDTAGTLRLDKPSMEAIKKLKDGLSKFQEVFTKAAYDGQLKDWENLEKALKDLKNRKQESGKDKEKAA